MPRIPLLVAVVAAGVLMNVSACGRTAGGSRAVAGEPASPSSSPSQRPSVSARPALPTPAPSPSTSGFPDGPAVACAGRPSADQVISLLRRTPNVLPAGATVTVRTGPLCAGTWQYTVIGVPDREPLQVLTRGAPGALTFVTAGTDVCTVTVRATAPAGILTAAHCV